VDIVRVLLDAGAQIEIKIETWSLKLVKFCSQYNNGTLARTPI
jgi:hypothetical protein